MSVNRKRRHRRSRDQRRRYNRQQRQMLVDTVVVAMNGDRHPPGWCILHWPTAAPVHRRRKYFVWQQGTDQELWYRGDGTPPIEYMNDLRTKGVV